MKVYVLMQTDSSNNASTLKCFKTLDALCSNLFANNDVIYIEPESPNDNAWKDVTNGKDLKYEIQRRLKKKGVTFLMYEDSDDWMCVIETELIG